MSNFLHSSGSTDNQACVIINVMKQYINKLLQLFLADLEKAGRVSKLPDFDILIPDLSHGDYSTNLGLKLASELRQNPNDIAGELASALAVLDSGQNKIFASVVPAGGFVNFTLSAEYLGSEIIDLSKEVSFAELSDQIGQGKKVVFEYSSPNTNKPLHIGHIRNDVYGKACINLLKAVGYDVVTCEIINDRGIHIMKSILMYMKYGNNQTPEQAQMKPDHFVGHFYKMFGQKSAENEQAEQQLNEEAQNLLQKWEQADPEVREVWQKMNNWFYEGAKQTYAKEGTTFDEVDFESSIYDKGRDLVMDGVAKGIFQQEEDKSVSITFPEQHIGKKYLLRKDGTTIYITQDMYLWDLRNKRHNPELAIVTTATEQSYHFEVLHRIFRMLGYAWADNFKHLPYEHVYLGKDKMSSRSGNSITADELLESVKARVRETMASLERLKGSVDDDDLVESVAFGAIKYGYLHYEPQTRIYFDVEQTISLEGNTGPYIQYAHARIKSLVEKAGHLQLQNPSHLSHNSEMNLMRILHRYNTAVQSAALEYKPNLLCNYLHELAGALNNFYNNVPVVKEPDEQIKSQRLAVLMACANVLKSGLGLLGIEAPDQM